MNKKFLYKVGKIKNLSSTYFEHPNVHPQEDFYMQFYGISFMHQYKQSGRWQYQAHPAIDQTAYMDA